MWRPGRSRRRTHPSRRPSGCVPRSPRSSAPKGRTGSERRRVAAVVGLDRGATSGEVVLVGAEFRRLLSFAGIRFLLRRIRVRYRALPDRFGVDVPVTQVDVSGGAGDDDRAGWVAGVGGDLVSPAAFVLQSVIMIALGLQV